MRTGRFGWLAWAAVLGGCGPWATPSLTERLQDEDPAVRARAAVEAGEQRDRQAVPYLIDRLTDRERAVRMFAIGALAKITGERRGYPPFGESAEQEEAARRWRRWWQQQGGAAASAAETPEGTSP